MPTSYHRQLVQNAGSLTERVLMRHFDKAADAKDGKATGDRTGVGIFLPIPEELAGQFPSLGPDDKSRPHVTILYVGDVPKEKEDAFLQTVELAADDLPPVMKARFNQLDYFQHPDKDRTIAHMSVTFSADLARFKYRLIAGLEELGLEVQDHFPANFFPHATLGYLPGLGSRWTGPLPHGMWSFDRVQVWGLPSLYEIVLGP